MKETAANPGRNIAMDWLRGIASIWVAIFHFNEPILYQDTFWRNFCKNGWLGVPAFFVISGWCMALLAARGDDWKKFLVPRFVRIFPPYWASLVVVAAVVVVRKIVSGANDVAQLPKSFEGVIATFALATSPVTDIPGVNWVYWSLSYEVAFYLTVALGLFLRQTEITLGVLSCVSFGFLVSDTSLLHTPVFFWIDKFPVFMVGYWAVRWLLTRQHRYLLAISIAGCFVVGFSSWHETLVAGLVILILVLGQGKGGEFLARSRFNGPFQFLGKISYSLYLTHVPIGCYLLIRLRPDSWLNNPWLQLPADLLILGVCVVAAWGFYCVAEWPAHRWAGKFTKRIPAKA